MLGSDTGALIDAKARAAYKERLEELRNAVDEAERFNDIGRSAGLREELDFVTRELARSLGLGGRARVAGSRAERDRVNVSRAIATALKRIAAQHEALGEHLGRTVHTGICCSYTPDPRAAVPWHTW